MATKKTVAKKVVQKEIKQGAKQGAKKASTTSANKTRSRSATKRFSTSTSSSSARTKTRARALSVRSRPVVKPAGSVEVVKLPIIDVTQEVKRDIVPAPILANAPPASSTPSPVEKHEDFQKALTQDPKRGFWARLFGRK
jgi:hypothetical protein